MLPHYIEPVYRPPSESRSLILQVTNGCSWNRCTFCEMYTEPQKKFRPKDSIAIDNELLGLAAQGLTPRRIFLADGDAMTLSNRRLRDILLAIRNYFPDVQRVSAYCLPRNVKNKSVDELTELQRLGLGLVYVGCESGDDEVLKRVAKGETWHSSLDALNKLQQAGIRRSVMILNGLGGQRYSEQHALNSASLMNAAQPEYLATLVVTFPRGPQRFEQAFNGEFTALNTLDLAREMEILLAHLDLDKTIFRSDHASNYLVLKGILNKDRERLLQIVRQSIQRPGSVPLRAEWQRGL